MALLARGADVEIDQFVCPFVGIVASQVNGVAHVAQALEVDALDGAAPLDVQTGDDAFC